MEHSIPSPLFILEMANNHMGDVEHGLRIVDECAGALQGLPYRFAVKLQYRDLDSFIHPAYRARVDVKHVKRFMDTRLSEEQFLAIKRRIEARGFLAMCTPFDEISADRVDAHGYDVVKVGSCSLTDWPLLERIALRKRPVIVSTAGGSLAEIDKVVSFFVHRDVPLALMHCVGIYPTPADALQLNQIDVLRRRYPEHRVGFSTHEPPGALDPVRLAVAKGATLFEKHVGVATGRYPLNAYSATPAQVRAWVDAAAAAWEMCGTEDGRAPGSERERQSLAELRRGAFVRARVRAGDLVPQSATFFAMPTGPGQLTANDFSKYAEVRALRAIEANEPVMADAVSVIDHREHVYQIASAVKGLLAKSRVHVPKRADLEISHHYGLERFEETGLTMITVVNRGYCKKLMVLLPGQRHPEQFHREKEETFHVLFGDLQLSLDGREQPCSPGDVLTVERNVRHAFSTREGAIVEELSSTHTVNDSYYTDPVIGRNANRKTILTYWLW
jgi:sialic acid synthase SpsE/quercetin dioxygenase-like cupin family protein